MRFFLSVFGVVVLLVVTIVLIATHNNINKPSPANSFINLDNYSNSSSSVVQITTGSLVANEQRSAVKVSISQSQRTISILTGYDDSVFSSENFPNTPAAYQVFLGAMQNARFTATRHTTEVNMFGVCPLGYTYQYQLYGTKGVINNSWSTSCSLTDGTFDGQGPLIRQLFDLQIPNYQNYVTSNPLSSNLYFSY